MSTYYLAVDIGASSGRHMLGRLKDGRILLEEIYRFPNGMVRADIFAGMWKRCSVRSRKG